MPQGPKFYFPVPSFVLRTIALGDIIADPYDPHNVLTTLDPSHGPLHANSHTTKDFTLRIDKHSSYKVDLQLFRSLGGGVGMSIDSTKDATSKYKIGVLETRFLHALRTDDITPRISDPRVQSMMKGGMMFRRNKPVYMVTGVMVAKDLTVTTEVSETEKGELKGVAMQESFRIREDVVFAYRLKKIELVKGKRQQVQINDFTSKAAFM